MYYEPFLIDTGYIGYKFNEPLIITEDANPKDVSRFEGLNYLAVSALDEIKYQKEVNNLNFKDFPAQWWYKVAKDNAQNTILTNNDILSFKTVHFKIKKDRALLIINKKIYYIGMLNPNPKYKKLAKKAWKKNKNYFSKFVKYLEKAFKSPKFKEIIDLHLNDIVLNEASRYIVNLTDPDGTNYY